MYIINFFCVVTSRELWERKPLLLKRHRPYYNDGLFSSAELDRILREVKCCYNSYISQVLF